jgi:hypothetical protein
MRGVDGTPLFDEAGKVVYGDLGSHLSELSSRSAKDIIASLGVAKDSKGAKALRKIENYVQRHQIDPADFTAGFESKVDEILNDSKWIDRYGQSSIVRDNTGRELRGLEAVKERSRQLHMKANYTAAEIDTERLIQDAIEGGTHSPEQIQQMRDLADGLERDGYKLVHGVEYMMPHDLAHATPMFKDVGVRHMNAVTLGNFFKGRLPEVAQRTAIQRQKLALMDELEKAGSSMDLSKDSADIDNLMEALHREVVRPTRERVEALAEDMKTQSWLRRRMSAIETSSAPVSMLDIGLGVNQKKVVTALTAAGYDEKTAMAAWRASKRFRNADFKDVGLYAIEAKLRQRNQLAGALHTLSGIKRENVLARPLGAAAIGAVAGAGVAALDSDGYGDVTTGALVGAGIGAGVNVAGAKKIEQAATKFEQSAWSRYGYVADNLARLRDQMRFTLSPWFDISRYTEGLMLAQTGAPLRKADGTRLILPGNISPTGTKKRLLKEISESGNYKGLEKFEQRQVVDQKWKEVRRRFHNASKGFNDADMDTIESTGQWFRQVGIMGFDPHEWEVSAFHSLTAQGLDDVTAARSAREMFTYGLQGRSPAEMSVNFIFFPFSFQKKAITHLTKYMAEDMSRAVLLHDAVKTYELLNERYDLSSFWKERMPVLEKLQQLNLFAFGLSPGRLGGINRPFEDAFGGAVMNLFTPHGISLKNAAEGAELQKVMKRSLPAINDISHLMQDMKEEGHVLFDDSHMTRAAQAREGYTVWNDYRTSVDTWLRGQGFTMADLSRQPELEEAYARFQARKGEIEREYPGWAESKLRATQKKVELAQEKNYRLANVQAGEGTTGDLLLFQFDSMLEAVTQNLQESGIADLEQAPTEVWTAIHQDATRFAQQSEEFKSLYKRFYEPSLGPLEVRI